MPYVVTESCCNDASCVYACPVNCIHPTPDEPDFGTVDMLSVDPRTCVDCGACTTACPVGAIVPQGELTAGQLPFVEINADFYRPGRSWPVLAKPVPPAVVDARQGPLRVAIVGSGPAAMYAADELLTQRGVTVTMLESRSVPYGLARYGIAPDHVRTRWVSRLFDVVAAQPGFRLYVNVTVGEHVSHAELLEHFHAVIYAVGAGDHRGLAVPGTQLPGSLCAADVVAWYNGVPVEDGDRTHGGRVAAVTAADLAAPRVVVIGNGNVALDVARVLTADPQRLAGTDIAPDALALLRDSQIEEVVVVARRGPAESAFTVPAFVDLLAADADVLVAAPVPEPTDWLPRQVRQKLQLLRAAAQRPVGRRRRIVFRYYATPKAILGADRVTGIELTDPVTSDTEILNTALVVAAVGYRGKPVTGLPFDADTGTVPNREGRVLTTAGGASAATTAQVLPGVYVTGWIKRGPTGFIGTNKMCAQQSVRQLVADFNAGRLTEPSCTPSDFAQLLVGRRNLRDQGSSVSGGGKRRHWGSVST